MKDKRQTIFTAGLLATLAAAAHNGGAAERANGNADR